jgi:ATP-dependent Lhr-like helicase
VSGRRWLDPETASVWARWTSRRSNESAAKSGRRLIGRRASRCAGRAGIHRASRSQGWEHFLEALAADRRAAVYHTSAGGPDLWVAADRLPQLNVIFPDASSGPPIVAPAALAEAVWSSESALVEIVRGRLEGLGPVTAQALAVRWA